MQCDILIIGGGLVGAALALALKDSPYSLVIVEANSTAVMQNDNFDARSLALSDASKNILGGLNLWQSIQKTATPIKNIHVSKKGQYGSTFLKSAEYKKQAFGYVSEIEHLNQIMQPLLAKQNNSHYLHSTKLINLKVNEDSTTASVDKAGKLIDIEAKLVVAADGTNSFVRQLLAITPEKKDYQQSAVVANIGLRRSHDFCAYERFTSKGLIALLPMTKQRASLVWACDSKEAKHIYRLSDDEFLAKLQNEFGYRLGRFERIGRRGFFPLQLQYLKRQYKDNIVFVGNASQTLHPIAGQGFNLGLRDVAILAELLMNCEVFQVKALLEDYQKKRQADQNRMINSTHSLVNFFGSNNFAFKWMQSFGLMTIDNLSLLSELLVQQAMGYSSNNSKLACGIPLTD